jgi:esterase/lipase
MKIFTKAVLVVHGFSGSLYDNEILVNYLQTKKGFDAFAYTLPGHDHDRFKRVEYTEWTKFLDEKIDFLKRCGYRKIYVVGHSMGGVLASYLAVKHKEVKKIVLISAAFNYIALEQMKDDLLKKNKNTKADYDAVFYKIFRIPFRLVLEFIKFIKTYHEIIKKVKVPILILQGDKDEIVPSKTGEYVFNNVESKNKWYTKIKNVRHRVLVSDKKEEVTEYIYCYLKGGKKWKRIKKLVL